MIFLLKYLKTTSEKIHCKMKSNFHISLRQFTLIGLVIATTLALVLGTSSDSFSQTKKQLQKQRDELNEQIEMTKKLLKESEKQQKSTTSQVQMLNEQLAYREKLLANINHDISEIDGEIEVKNKDIETLGQQVSSMKEEYGKMIYQAYRNRSSYDKLMYVFSSENFYQAYKRMKMTQRYAEVRKKQANLIADKQQEITINVSQLEQSKNNKLTLAEKKAQEKQEMEANKVAQQKKLTELKSEENKLRDQQKKQKADRDRLTSKIQEIIAEEIRKENVRKEEERKKNAAANKTTTTSTAATSSASKSTKLELAPETVLINTDFEKNKGLLPWPISAGVITSHFGKHQHPSLDQVTVNNNGVDFTTEKNASANAVFGGTVSSVFSIPGAGQNIIITHGSYKTVYSGLSDVVVKVGDKVNTRQKIGTVMFDGEEHTLHFEVWKVGSEGGSAQNPEMWMKKK
jgi:septal ring factor EnvC (AmiA/AmiB activator)